MDGKAAGLALWQLFGTTNQVMAGLTLLTVTLYLMHRRRPFWYTALPMLFMLVTTLVAMCFKLRDFWTSGAHLLLIVGGIILALSLWLGVEAALKLRKGKGGKRKESGDPVA